MISEQSERLGTALTELATATTAPGGSATRCSTRSLATAIPRWIDLDHLAACFPYPYSLPIPAGAAPAIRAGAAAHADALAPAQPEETRAVLVGLRSATILIGEDEQEARASFKMLRAHLADVPIDILEAACRAYCNHPGRRFFPRSAGELRAFVNPLVAARRARAFHLERLADQAAAMEAERRRLEDDPCSPEAAAAILREVRARWSPLAVARPA